jgi:probable rRNA maturation factor
LFRGGSGEQKVIILKKNVAGLSKSSLARFLTLAMRAAHVRGMINVVVTNNREMRSLNRRFRGINEPTDVLSFPSDRPVSRLAGEIAISAEIASANSTRLGHSLGQEVKILMLHGVLHLAGYDHERDNGAMARQEARLRRALKLPTSLTERSENHVPRSVTRQAKGIKS